MQGVFVTSFGAMVTGILLISAVMLFSSAPAKTGLGEYRGLIIMLPALAIQVAAYSRFRRKLLMNLPIRAQAAMFALGVFALVASVGLIILFYLLWVRP